MRRQSPTSSSQSSSMQASTGAESSDRRTETLKREIIAALSHEEAEDGLYLRNFNVLDAEEDTRPAVNGDEYEILYALEELMKEGRVTCSDEAGHETIFYLARPQ